MGQDVNSKKPKSYFDDDGMLRCNYHSDWNSLRQHTAAKKEFPAPARKIIQPDEGDISDTV